MLLLATAGLQHVHSIQLNVSSSASIRNASTALAYNLMSWYQNNQSSTAVTAVGTFPAPLYWWEAGAIWGGMIDYWAYTNDTSYNPTITQALLAQVGPDNNYMPPAYYSSLGNDDQAFWAFTVLTAVEYGLPETNSTGAPTWLSLAEAVFNTMVPRWDTTTCGGGLKWQIFSYNAGYDYKNSISNGGFFQISARLARYTGNQTYLDWAEKIWDWSTGIGLIDANYNVFDGSDDTLNCTELDHQSWSYEPSVYLYGAATLYNYTNASDLWANRTAGLLESSNRTFFSPYKNASNIMFEPECEPANTCNYDQYSFKAYMARWLGKTAVVAPFTREAIQNMLVPSAEAAAQSCSGGTDGVTCGVKWYVGGYDGGYGPGQQLSGLEVVQALLADGAPDLRTDGQVKIELAPTTTLALPTTATSTAAVDTGASSSGGVATTPHVKKGLATKVGYVSEHSMKAVWLALLGLVFVNR